MRIPKISAAAGCAALLSLAACGSDSTGPSNLGSTAALQSLRLGLPGIFDVDGPSGATTIGSFGAIAPTLDQINVDIDGKSRSMFALVLRQSFPAGACQEDIYVDPFSPPPTVCTPMALGTVLVLWQSHAASSPPDRMVFIVGDEGATNFDLSLSTSVPGFAFYIDGANFLVSSTGNLTSHTASAAAACSVPLPQYAKSGTCTLATFSEQGTIAFETDVDAAGSPPRTVTIAPQSVHGVWLAVTEIQPLTLPPPVAVRGVPGFGRRL